jgi:hypothetical protein
MKTILEQEIKTFWYYSESGFPTYLAIESYRKQSPSYTHSIENKKTWEELTKKNQKKIWIRKSKKILIFNILKRKSTITFNYEITRYII